MFDRRAFLRYSALVAATAAGGGALAGCGSRGGSAADEDDSKPKEMRFAWWGHETMNRTTREALELYHRKNPLVTLAPENAAWDDFWDRMATQIAGRNAPDAFQMSNQMITEYAKRGALLDLEPFIGQFIDLNGWNEDLRSYGIFDGRRAGVPISTDAFMVMYDVAFMDAHGIQMPERDWTWDTLAEHGRQVRESGGGQVWGMSDGSGKYELLEPWVRGRGKKLFNATEDPVTLAFDREDLGDFMNWWEQRRTEGACVPPEIAAEDTGHETSPFVRGTAPIYFTTSSELLGVRELVQNPCEAMPVPDQPGGVKKANFVRPNLFMSAWTGTEYPKEAARFLNFWINDPEAVQVIGASRGVPPSPAAAALLETGAAQSGVRSPSAYLDLVREIGSPMDSLTPKGGRDVYNLLRRTAEEIRFKQRSISEAVDGFFAQAAPLITA